MQLRLKSILAMAFAMLVLPMAAQTTLFDDGWRFAFGSAASPEKDFGRATEYFNYFTKAASVHNEGPYAPKQVAAIVDEIGEP